MPKKEQYPKLMVNDSGWHERARNKKEEEELLESGFKYVVEETTEPEEE